MTANDLRLVLIVASIIFNFGGFFWLARNHFHSVNKRLDTIESRIHTMELTLERLNERIK